MKLSEVKKIVKRKMDSYSKSYELYKVILGLIEENEGKNYDKRFLDKVKALYPNSKISYEFIGSMQKLSFYGENWGDREESFLLNHGDKEILASEFEGLNTCYQADNRRRLDGITLLFSNNDDLKQLNKKLNQLAKLNAEIEELTGDGKPLDSYFYAIKKGFNNEG